MVSITARITAFEGYGDSRVIIEDHMLGLVHLVAQELAMGH